MEMTTMRLGNVILFLVAAAGCHRAPQPAPGAHGAPRDLALLPPDGERAPVNELIVQMQHRVEREPGKLDWWVALGRAWARKARESGDPSYFTRADACADEALAIAPGSPIALDLRGLVLLNDHRFEEARALAGKIVADSPRDPMAWGTLSDALLELGRFDDAADAAQKMIALKPALPSYARASYLRWLRGDVIGAREIMRLAVDAASPSRRDPEPRAWALVQAALLFWHEGDYDGADAGFALALAGFPDFPPALVGRARVALARGDAQRAVALLETAYARSSLVETAWLLGDARRLAGDAAGARAAFRLVEQQGRRSDPRTLSLYLASTGGDAREALRLAEEERRRRGDLYTRDAYAWALFAAGRLPEARAASDEALALGTRDARLWYHAGAIRIASGDVDGGRALLRRALALSPQFDVRGAAEAARLIGNPTAKL
jgi:tetratricopeptide (TPR) repeat protein